MSVYDERISAIRLSGSIETCPICLQAMVEPAVLVPCRHRFCVACCTTYLRANCDSQSAPCPVCRTEARLADVETETGENLRRKQIAERTDEGSVFDLQVSVRMVSFGATRQARHPIGEQALTPSARSPNLWEICDSCFFCVQATAGPLAAGRYVALLHVKRLTNFTCAEPVHVAITGDDVTVRRDVFLDRGPSALPPDTWTFLELGRIRLHHPGAFHVTVEADNADWWKSGLIFDCLCVRVAGGSSARRRKRASCVVS